MYLCVFPTLYFDLRGRKRKKFTSSFILLLSQHCQLSIAEKIQAREKERGGRRGSDESRGERREKRKERREAEKNPKKAFAFSQSSITSNYWQHFFCLEALLCNINYRMAVLSQGYQVGGTAQEQPPGVVAKQVILLQEGCRLSWISKGSLLPTPPSDSHEHSLPGKGPFITEGRVVFHHPKLRSSQIS